MTSYNRTVIFEANYNNSIEADKEIEKSNDFACAIPSIEIPKGSTVSLDGAIIQQTGAGGDIIELSDKNYNDKYPYTSSFMGIQYALYINHIGQNMVAFPMVAFNAFKLQNIPQDLILPNGKNVFIIAYRQKLFLSTRYLVSGVDNDGNHIDYYLNSWDDVGRTCILYENTPTDDSDDYSIRFYNKDHQTEYDENELPDDTIATGDYRANEELKDDKFFYITSPANVATAIRGNGPNSQKWFYLDNKFNNPTDKDQKADLLYDYMNVDLSKKILETPDEVSFKINQQWDSTKINNEINKVPVLGARYDIDSGPRIGELTPEIKGEPFLQDLFNLTGTTVKNIPANLQTSPSTDSNGNEFFKHKVYSNMFVQNWKRWRGGVEFLSMLDGDDGGGNFDSSKVVDVNDITIENHDTQEDIMLNFYNDYAEENRTSINFFPALLNYSYHPNIQAPYHFGEGGDVYRSSDNNFEFVFYMEGDDNGDPIEQEGFTYFVQRNDYRTPPHVFNDYYIGMVNADIDGTQFIGLYELPNGDTKPYTPRLLKYKIKMGNNLMKQNPIGTNSPVFSIGVIGDDAFTTVGSIIVQGTSATAEIRMGEEIIYNGLPYLEVGEDNNCGGQYGDSEFGGREIQHSNNDYTAIPRYYPLATNIAIDVNDILGREDFVKTTMQRIQTFMRMNEIYIGSKTEYKEQQNDVKNWFVEFDLGFHNDYAISMYNTSANYVIPNVEVDDIIPETVGNVRGFTFWDKWFCPLKRNSTADTMGYREANIFSMGRYKTMGEEYKSLEQKLRVFSRFQPDLFENNLHTLNSYVGTLNENLNGTSLMGLSPNIEVLTGFKEFFDQTKKFNICLVPMEFFNADGDNPQCCGFVNFQTTFKGDGGASQGGGFKGFSYNFNNPSPYRSVFRILSGINFGFDPSATANPFGVPMSVNQCVKGNNHCAKLVETTYIGNPDNPQYSSYIEEYVSQIWIGATKPTIDLGVGSRFELTNLHTPFRMNAFLGGGDDATGGDDVIYFNLGAEPSNLAVNFNVISAVPQIDNAENIITITTLGHINKNITDSVSGIGIMNLFVRGENSRAETIQDDGALICSIDDTDKTLNYRYSLFDFLGFDLIQLLPRYGQQSKRFDNNTYNKIGNKLFGLDDDWFNYERYAGISFFTTNSFISQSNCQDISIFGLNYPDTADSKDVVSTPNYMNAYVNNQPLALSAETDRLRAERLPNKIQDPYYIVYSDLPTNGYYLKGNRMNIIGYIFKQYKNQSYYFNYAQNYSFTLTQDMVLTKIRTAIYSGRTGELALNLGDNIVFFYKATIPSVLSELPQPNPQMEMEEKENRLLEAIIDGQKLDRIQNKTDNIKSISIKEAIKILEKDKVSSNPTEYAEAIKAFSTLTTNYLLTQLISNNTNRQILSDFRAKKFESVNKKIVGEILNNRKKFKQAYGAIMSDITSSDYDTRENAMKELQEATRNRVNLKNIGIKGAQVIGFPKTRGLREPFFLDIDPTLSSTISEVIRGDDPDIRKELLDLLNENLNSDFNIKTREKRIYRRGFYPDRRKELLDLFNENLNSDFYIETRERRRYRRGFETAEEATERLRAEARTRGAEEKTEEPKKEEPKREEAAAAKPVATDE